MNILILVESQDLPHAGQLRSLLQGHTGYIVNDKILTLTELLPVLRKRDINAIVCASPLVLKKLICQESGIEDKKADLKAHSGSMFKLLGLPCLIVPNTKQLRTVPHARFLFSIWLKKLTNPNFPSFPEMDWEIVTQDNAPELLEEFKDAVLMAVDIETTKEEIDPEIHLTNPPEFRGLWVRGKASKTGKKLMNFIPKITMVGYCGLFKNNDDTYRSKSIVLYINTMVDITWMRNFNVLPAAKIMQNGGYDSSYFIRYASPLDNYLWDTFTLMHSWFAELPRDLPFITSLLNKDFRYWKDEAETNLAEYNAKDIHTTLWNFIYLIQYMPQWAKDNYAENFRMQFPCITCGLEGLDVDEEIKENEKSKRERVVEINRARLEYIITEGFNPNSAKQVLTLIHGLGFKKVNNTDVKALTKFKEAHPLNEFFVSLITQVREDRKAVSTYFDTPLLDGRLLYELNPGGTATGRLASKASNFWCGTQIQNIPPYAKPMCVADAGWLLGAIDNGQSESRCTAYISEDQNLIRTVEESEDFHKTNASLFFGMPVSKITAAIRKVAKRVNHGSTYNMGWYVLWETMGTKAVLNAKKLLGIASNINIKGVCTYLLSTFDNAYPDIRGKFYPEVIEEILLTGKLVGATGWTRLCFGDPTKSKPILNSYIAHPPQSLSVKIINAAFFDTWLRLQIGESKIRMKAQVHDEIFYQYRPEDRDYCAGVISKRMEKPTIVRGRSMVIPNDPVLDGKCWADLKE